MTVPVPDDFFAPDGPPRDRWGRPMLIPRVPPKPSEPEKRYPYTRASSLADMISNFAHLHKWKMRYLARSLGQNSDLAMLAGAECYTTGFDKGNEKDNRESGKRLDDIINRALDRGKISEKADYGTVVHALTEPGNDGNVDDMRVRADVASFWALLEAKGIQIIGTEVFTANDELMVAGTFDHLCYVPGYGIVITDKKTSSEVHGNTFRIQLATYANADVLDWETDTRMTLEEFIESKGWDPALLNRDKGLIFWIKDGKTELFEVDLKAGKVAAEHAAWVRDYQNKGKHEWLRTEEIAADKISEEESTALRGMLLHWIADMPDRASLDALWVRWQHVWTEAHTEATKLRLAALSG